MTCYTCTHPAGYAEPVPGKETLRLVCHEHKGPDAQHQGPADIAAAFLFGADLPWMEQADA